MRTLSGCIVKSFSIAFGGSNLLANKAYRRELDLDGRDQLTFAPSAGRAVDGDGLKGSVGHPQVPMHVRTVQP
ncbi:hypothetical protein YWIDRAFT_08029 [Streptomyces sp. SceaMP-e96]|nr:hypothetical protein YWIDRAFT_08029 [Streptomyces sp. SceaMP-e96]